MNTPWDNVEHFEGLIAEYAGSDYAVAVDSCTNALFLSLKLLDSSGPIIVPIHTYISVPMQVAHCNYKIQFEDIQWSGSYSLDPLPIIDSAQRFTENMYTPGTLHCLSFHSKKLLSIGRGGMILTNDKSARDWLRRSRHDGRPSIYSKDMTYHNVPTLGWHMYMTPEQAVRGIEQFYKTPTANKDSGCSDDYELDLSQVACFKPCIV